MNHTVIRTAKSEAATEPPSWVNKADDIGLMWSVVTAWNAHGNNDWLPVLMLPHSECVLMAKSRGFRKSEQTIGWGVLIITVDECNAVEALPMGERDAYLCTLCNIPEADREWWTRQY